MKLDVDPKITYPELDMGEAIRSAAQYVPEWVDQMYKEFQENGELDEIRTELAELENIEIREEDLIAERELYGEDLPDDV